MSAPFGSLMTIIIIIVLVLLVVVSFASSCSFAALVPGRFRLYI
jgi:hypothetical protein